MSDAGERAKPKLASTPANGPATTADSEVESTTGNVVWLASFPKSGNTWIRAIITAARGGDRLFAVGQLTSGAQPHHVGSAHYAYALDPRLLDRSELRQLRDSLVSRAVDQGTHAATDEGPDQVGDASLEPSAPPDPTFRKTHEVYRTGQPGQEPFPARATRAAILIVRDPRSVVCSWAPFFGTELAEAAQRIGAGKDTKSSPANSSTEQPWGTWSSHARSWLEPTLPFPVHLVRYEDLQQDTVATLLPVLNAVGWQISEAELAQAVHRTKFERLVAEEADRGFRETSPKTNKFFRRGRAQAWREELSPDLISQVAIDHEEMMNRLGYEPSEIERRDSTATHLSPPE